MSRCEKLEDKARRAPRGLKFDELVYLVACNGFVLDRQSGSHRIYLHPSGERINLQPGTSGDAKPYQVHQVIQKLDRIRRLP